MPWLRKPMELGAPPSLARRVARTLLVSTVVVALFVTGLSVWVLAVTD